jgi:type I restriction enzyme M protein
LASTRVDTGPRPDLWRELDVELDPAGRIVDYLNSAMTRTDGPEERVRQHYARVLVEEYGYPKERLAFEVPIHIGREVKFADIGIFNSPSAAAEKLQGQIALVVETKEPTEEEGLARIMQRV